MGMELKIRIRNHKKIEEHLKKKGAKFIEELEVLDTYFNQPEGEVLKTVEDGHDSTLVRYKEKEGKFETVQKEKIDDIEKKKKDLGEIFGIKAVLKKKMRFFSFGEYRININLIEDIGEFLILEGEKPTKEFMKEKLGFKNPEYITVPFSDLRE